MLSADGPTSRISSSIATRSEALDTELAVMQVGSQTFVWRVTPAGKAQKVEVDVGGRIPGKAMIRTGLNAGDRIVVDGVGKVKADATLKAAAPAADGAARK